MPRTLDGGDRLGKTIIFAVNQQHAQFIARRFDHHYPHYKGAFARVITHSVNYAQSLIDDFSIVANLPQIAISVDMLDTGIDVPEVVNLVFFKTVRSKVKFLQMIGRGTRLCPDLFGPGQDKREFFIFDFCANFEYFDENPAGAVGSLGEPLQKRLFKRRLELMSVLPNVAAAGSAGSPAGSLGEGRGGYDALVALRGEIADELHGEVAAMNLGNFIVRPQGEHVGRFRERKAWDGIDEGALTDLREHVAGLPSERDPEHITAKLFDLVCLNLQLALVNTTQDFITCRDRIIEVGMALETMDAIPAVKAKLALIQEVQTEAFWKDITVPMIESVRRGLRDLVKFIERKAVGPIYTVLTDQKGEAKEVGLKDFSTGINLARYKRKVEAFIRASENHVAIAKLKHNKPLTPTDLSELERFVYESDVVESRKRFEEGFGANRPLTLFIRSLVGLDRNAAKEAFGQFLDGNRYTSQQIRFVEMIIDRLTRNGLMDPGQLYEPPFTALHYQGLDGAFGDRDAEMIIETISDINQRAAA